MRWHGVGPNPDLSEDSHSLAYLLLGSSQEDDDLYVLINAWWNPLNFTIQDGNYKEWRRVIDTSAPSPSDFLESGKEAPLDSQSYRLAPPFGGSFHS